MVLSRKRRQKLRLEQINNQTNQETPQTTLIHNNGNVTGKKRKRGKKGSELEGKIDAFVDENGEKVGVNKSFQVGVVNGESNELKNISNEKKKKKKKKKKVKKKKIKVVEEDKEEKLVEVKEQIVEENSKENDGGASKAYVGGISEQVVEETSNGNDEGARKVYVGGMPYYYTEDDIRSYFNHCGAITDIDCMIFTESGKFRGIAFITFETEEAAENALLLDGSDMDGRYLTIQPYKSNRPSKTSDFSPPIIQGYNRIYAGNLSYDITEGDVRKFFSDCNISTIRFGEDKDTGEFKGYAHVDFADNESLNKALKLDQKFVCGRPMKISRAVPTKGAVRNGVSTPTAVKPESKIGLDLVVTPQTVTPQINSGVNFAITTEYNSVVDEVAPPPTENKSEITSAKLKRRTCYDCGERGHISSDCPKKQSS